MLRRRSRPPAAPPSRASAIRVLAGAPHRVEPVSADLLPSRSRHDLRTPVPVAAPLAGRIATAPADAPGLRPRTVDERAGRIRAMARAAAQRASARRR